MVFRKEIRVFVSLGIILIYYTVIKYIVNNPEYKEIFDILFWFILCVLFYIDGKQRAKGKLKHKTYYIIWMFVAGVLYMLSYFASGFIDGFGKTMYDISFKGIARNIVTLGSVIILKEWVRFHLINSMQKKFSLYFGIGIVFVYSMMDINLVVVFQLKDFESIIIYICASVLPIIALNTFLTYGSYIAGFGATLLYVSITKFTIWLLPVLPNSKWITLLLVGASIPILGILILSNTHRAKTRRGKKRKDKEENPYTLLLTATVVVMLVWFSLRIFPAYPTVIASNSMYPDISRGDMVIAIKDDYDELMIDDIIEYQLEDIRVVHRIVEIEYMEGDIFLITKGDANSIRDDHMVSRQQYLGTIKTVIPYLGYPSLIFYSAGNQDLVETGQDAP